MRDQLDRFGEIDTTAGLLAQVAEATTGTVVLNREDPRISALAAQTPARTRVAYFGLTDDLLTYFPTDDDMHAQTETRASGEDADVPSPRPGHSLPADVVLEKVMDHRAVFRVDGRQLETVVRLEGVYNLYNAAAALALVRSVLADNEPDDARLMEALAQVTPA